MKTRRELMLISKQASKQASKQVRDNCTLFVVKRSKFLINRRIMSVLPDIIRFFIYMFLAISIPYDVLYIPKIRN